MDVNNKYKLLVVDDEDDICQILKFNLENEGYVVDTALSVEEAMKMNFSSYSLLLLDVMMGTMSGFQLARHVKSDPNAKHIPIIFLTAKGSENDKITGLTLGADDYISKPFSIREVILRVAAVIRRTASVASVSSENLPDEVSYKGLVFNATDKTITVNGTVVVLTKTEYNLLHTLMAYPSRVFSRQELIDIVWPSDVLVIDRTVDVNITRLRKKVGPYAENIVTRPGFGYLFNP